MSVFYTHTHPPCFSRFQVLSGNQISIVKIYNYDNPITWTDEPGPLRIKAINTGAGRLTVGAEVCSRFFSLLVTPFQLTSILGLFQ